MKKRNGALWINSLIHVLCGPDLAFAFFEAQYISIAFA